MKGIKVTSKIYSQVDAQIDQTCFHKFRIIGDSEARIKKIIELSLNFFIVVNVFSLSGYVKLPFSFYDCMCTIYQILLQNN
jgi:hypothetical protein